MEALRVFGGECCKEHFPCVSVMIMGALVFLVRAYF